MIRGVLFDKDGTLLDFDLTWGRWADSFLRDLAADDAALLGRLADAVAYDLVQQKFWPDSPVIAGTPEEGVALIHPHLPDWEFQALLAHSNATAKGAPLAPVVPLAPFLDDLQGRGLKTGVATNDAEATARAHMAGLGVEGHFDAILGSDSGFGGKPDPGMCLAFADQMALAPEHVAMVGDSLHDLHAGRAAGMICVGVLTSMADKAQLAPYADVVLSDIGQLVNWLDETST